MSEAISTLWEVEIRVMFSADHWSVGENASMMNLEGHLLRCHRARSWILRAEALENNDWDTKFIAYWIAFNALYGQAKYRWPREKRKPEEDDIDALLRLVVGLDQDASVTQALVDLRKPVEAVVTDPFLSGSSWKVWDEHEVVDRQKRLTMAIGTPRNKTLLHRLFAALYVLRNQIFHGCSTVGSSKNRQGIEKAVVVLARLVPTFENIVRQRGRESKLLADPPYRPSAGSARGLGTILERAGQRSR